MPPCYSTLLIDDNEDTCKLNTTHGYAVWRIKEFHADEVDWELRKALRYIKDVLRLGIRFERLPTRHASKAATMRLPLPVATA